MNDTSAQTLDTLHGKVEFIQFVGITESELDAIRKDGSKCFYSDRENEEGYPGTDNGYEEKKILFIEECKRKMMKKAISLLLLAICVCG